MTTKSAAAWALIRAADPMNSIDVTGASEAPVARDLLHRITTNHADVPASTSGADDVLTVLDHRPDGHFERRGRRLTPGLAAAVVIVLVVAAIATVWRQHGSTTLPPQRQRTAAGYSKALLAQLPLPAGAARVGRPPIPELKQSAYTGSGIVDAQLAWWTVPGSLTAAVAQFGRAGDLPAHWRFSESSTGGAGPRSNGWMIEVRDPRARFVASLSVAIAAHGSTVGLAAQVDTYAVAARTPSQVIAPATDSATFTLSGGGGQGPRGRITRTVIGPRVTTLALEVNATPAFVPLTVASCPPYSGSAVVTFRRGSERWTLHITNGSFLCNTPSLTGTAGTSIDLRPSTSLLTDLLTAVGLPSDYFGP